MAANADPSTSRDYHAPQTTHSNPRRPNLTIDQLINQGYLLKKKPFIEENRRSYLTVFSFIDPGMVTYLTGATDIRDNIGQRIEGIVHTYLNSIIINSIPLKTSLSYYKPYNIDVNNKVKFKEGEIDFVFKSGDHLCAIETKTAMNMNPIRTPILAKFVHDKKLPFGVVVYGGIPYRDKENIYWPYWLM